MILASAGIDCTPMLSMLEHLTDTAHTAPVTVLHTGRSPADHAPRTDHRAPTHKLPIGQTTRNPRLERRGTTNRIAGNPKQAWGKAKEAKTWKIRRPPDVVMSSAS
ncbi:hypothetical protein [Streptomyces sp. NBC_00435]|uniref:hypothetical protein n=1 Tax=Streptomyces sp. NBC_00435 TaxID=2903649 RepID=UPI003FA7CF7B